MRRAVATVSLSGTLRQKLEAIAAARFDAISANYDDDRLARFALDPAQVERLRRLGILYDRDDSGGEYFHIYGESFADRFFFEIVQRSHYDGYGALDAPARMASQEQSEARA